VFTKITDLTDISERLAKIRRAYGNRIDLPDLGRAAFAMLIGVSAIEYEAYETGDRMPTVDFLTVLHNKTGTTWDRSGTVRSPTLPDRSQRPQALAANHPQHRSRPPAGR
jgi:transcriptional regulator with XRE-family HTH domain